MQMSVPCPEVIATCTGDIRDWAQTLDDPD